MSQLIAHAVGDYLLQSHWMATRKTKSSVAAAAHALTYSSAFIPLRPTIPQFLGIASTHFLIDRFRLARWVVWLKNGAPRPMTETGYPADAPSWLSTWLLIAADNTIHVLVNALILRRKG